MGSDETPSKVKVCDGSLSVSTVGALVPFVLTKATEIGITIGCFVG